ncbi:MAG: serine hydrolase domain-containing protein [Gemmatimonadales bacterium]
MRALRVAILGITLAACRGPGLVPPSVGLPVAAPESLGFDGARLAAVAAYLRAEVDSGSFPGAVVAVGRHGRLALLAAVGRYGDDDPRAVDPSTLYDLASLTKVVGLTGACMLLVADGRLDVEAPAQRYVPAFRGPGKERVTIRHLLTHSSGLPAWRPLYTEAPTRAAALLLADTTALATPAGQAAVYSDLGAIVLTQAVEQVAGEPLDAFLARRVFEPLGMTATRFRPPVTWRDRIAPTEKAPQGDVIRGVVHDENAWRLGGVSGHAGLFSNAPDLARFAVWLLGLVTPGQRPGVAGTPGQRPGVDSPETPGHRPGVNPPVLPSELVREFTRRQDLVPGSSRALGWDTPSEGSSAGTRLSPRAFGHTGFTGTSIWLDPERDLFIILLTNRVHPTRENLRILKVRPRVADLVVAALTAPEG